MYEITQYTKNQAKKHDVIVKPSLKKGKKIEVIKNNNIIASIGSLGYSDYPNYVKTHGINYAKNRQKLYKIRHAKDRNLHNTNGYWADKLLW